MSVSEITYDPTDSEIPNRVLSYIRTRDIPSNTVNTLVNPDVSQVDGILAQKYWLADIGNNRVISMSAQQIAQVDSDNAASLLSSQRAFAKTLLDTPDGIGKQQRCTVEEIAIEFNRIIDNHNSFQTSMNSWITSFQAAVAGAASLAALKTAVAAIPTPVVVSLVDLTFNNVVAAIKARIDAGTRD